MENAQLYSSSNAMQKRDAVFVLDQFVPLMDWTSDDVILDVGSGSGDVTRNILLPRCANFRQIIGIDVSEEMVKFAQSRFTHERLAFRQVDLTTTSTKFNNEFPHGFNKIFSFYTLHWIKDQRKLLENLYELLVPRGFCLLVFLAQNPIFDLYERLAANNKWSSFMQDVNKFIPFHQKSIDPAAEFQSSLEEKGFQVLTCTAPQFQYTFENVNILRNAMKAVNPFVNRIPTERQNEYMNDCIDECRRMKTTMIDGKFVAQYRLMVALATRQN